MGAVLIRPKQAIALEVTLDHRELGQITEAVVENAPFGAADAPGTGA